MALKCILKCIELRISENQCNASDLAPICPPAISKPAAEHATKETNPAATPFVATDKPLLSHTRE